MDDLLKCKYAPVIAGVKFQCAGNYGHSGPHTFHNEAPDFDCIQQRLDTGGWIPVAERLPDVPIGKERICWIHLRIKGRDYVRVSWFVNRPAIGDSGQNDWEIADEDGAPLDCVGWHEIGCNRNYDKFFMPEQNAEYIVAWQEIIRPLPAL